MIPGTTDVCGWEIIAERASPSIEPRSAWGGCDPSPRNDRPAVSRIIQPIVVDMAMIITGRTLGRSSVRIMRRMPHPGQPGGVDELAARKPDRDAANVACKERDVDRGHGNQRVHQSGAKRGHNGQRQQDIGKCHQHIDAAHDDVVGAPAEIPRDDPDRRPDRRGNQRGGDRLPPGTGACHAAGG